MKKIAAIAFLTIRAAVHSRVVAAAITILVIITLGLPFIMKGDGSPESLFSIYVNYVLSIQTLILALVAAWSGAGAISLEIDSRQMQVVTVKPVRAMEIWIGKLLGLTAINFILLVFGSILLYAMLKYEFSCGKFEKAGRKDLVMEVMSVYHAAEMAGAYSPSAVDPGRKTSWQFNIPGPEKDIPFALLKYKFLPSPFYCQSTVIGTWRAFTEKNNNLFSNTVAACPHMALSLKLPRLSAPSRLEIEYLNMQTNPAVTVFFPSENDLRLMIPQSSFESNFLRGMIMTFARLCCFTSLGLMAGALFSFPVAVFLSMGFFGVAFSGGFARQIAECGFFTIVPGKTFSRLLVFFNEAVRGFFHFISTLVSPFERFDPLAYLANNLLISWQMAAEAVLVLCGIYSLALIIIGAFCLSRREIGLPSS